LPLLKFQPSYIDDTNLLTTNLTCKEGILKMFQQLKVK